MAAPAGWARREPRLAGPRKCCVSAAAAALIERWRTARPTYRSPAALLGIPNTTMFDYEWAVLQHHLNCRLATRVLVPDAIPRGAPRALRNAAPQARPLSRAQGGVLPRRLRARSAVSSSDLGVDRDADPLRGAHRAVLRALPRRLGEPAAAARCCDALSQREDAQTVVLAAHTRAGRRHCARSTSPRVVVPSRAVDGRSLVALRRRARLRGRHDEPRGGRARHAGVVDLRGPPGRGRRAAPARGAAAAARSTPRR